MLLRKLSFCLFLSFIIGTVASNLSFDFENYSLYAAQPEVALERFNQEPVFPLFIFFMSSLGFSSETTIFLFLTLGVLLTVYATVSLANKPGGFIFFRSLTAILLTMPFILFGAIVPRQGLAIGLVLLALIRVLEVARLRDWIVILLLSIALVTHNAVALFGIFLIFSGHLKPRNAALFCAVFLFWFFLSNDNPVINLISLENIVYEDYLNNFRETGNGRILFFLGVAMIYLSKTSIKIGGYFAPSGLRNFLVALSSCVGCVFLYSYVATDCVRFTYLIGIIMLTEMVRMGSFQINYLFLSKKARSIGSRGRRFESCHSLQYD